MLVVRCIYLFSAKVNEAFSPPPPPFPPFVAFSCATFVLLFERVWWKFAKGCTTDNEESVLYFTFFLNFCILFALSTGRTPASYQS